MILSGAFERARSGGIQFVVELRPTPYMGHVYYKVFSVDEHVAVCISAHRTPAAAARNARRLRRKQTMKEKSQ